MIDIKLVRENPGLVKDNIKKKFQNEKLPLVDKVRKLDEEWRKLKYKGDALRSERNKISQEINQAKKQKKDAKALIKKAKEIPRKIAMNEGKAKKLGVQIDKIMQDIPNILLPGVPIAKEEKDAKVIKKVGKPKKFAFKPKDHAVLGEKLKVLDEFLNVSHNSSGELRNDTISSLQIINGTITDIDISDTTNLTLGQKITFALGEIIDNIVNGWIKITGGLNVTENLVVTKNFTVDTETLFVDSNSDRVGVGTITPQNTLNVVGDGNFTGNVTIGDTLKLTNSSTIWDIYVNVNGTLVWEQE